MSTPDQIEANRGYTGKSAGRTNEVPAGPSDAGRRAGRAGTRAISEFESQVLDRIRQSAASGHLTEFGLAMAAGVGHGTTHGVLCDKRRASVRVLSALACAAGLGWGDLIDIVRGYPEEERSAVGIRQGRRAVRRRRAF